MEKKCHRQWHVQKESWRNIEEGTRDWTSRNDRLTELWCVSHGCSAADRTTSTGLCQYIHFKCANFFVLATCSEIKLWLLPEIATAVWSWRVLFSWPHYTDSGIPGKNTILSNFCCNPKPYEYRLKLPEIPGMIKIILQTFCHWRIPHPSPKRYRMAVVVRVWQHAIWYGIPHPYRIYLGL